MSSEQSIWHSFEIENFLEYLRVSKGYSIGLSEFQTIQKLLIHFTAVERVSINKEKLEELLAPILCKTINQQRSFTRDLEEWLAMHAELSDSSDNQEIGFKELEQKIKKKTSLWQRIIFSTFIALLLIISSLYFSWNSGTTGGNTPNNTPEEITNNPLTNYGFGVLISIFLLVVSITIFLWLRKRIRKAETETYLKRESLNDRLFQISQFFVPELSYSFFQNLSLIQTAKKFNTRILYLSKEIDVNRTIRKTLDTGGHLSYVDRWLSRKPEYLVLIDRKTSADHQANYIDTLIQTLILFDVSVEVYYFDKDPRNSYSKINQHTSNLTQLAKKFPDHSLLLFTSRRNFLDFTDMGLVSWTKFLHLWEVKVLFSLDVINRSDSINILLQELVSHYPATQEGLERFIISHSGNIQFEPKPLPRIFQQYQLNYLIQHPPSSREQEWLIDELKSYLSNDGFYWLAACAIYPEIEWNLTLFLGNTLKTDSGSKLYTFSTFLDLIRLPWFRFGRMPDWFRLRLIYELPPSLEKEIRHALYGLFTLAVKKPISDFKLEYAKVVDQKNLELHKQVIQSLKENRITDSELDDFVFEGFMEETLTIKIPKNRDFQEAETLKEIKVGSTSKMIDSFWSHPKGLYILCLTEMWERFSYYGMRAILVLFLVQETSSANPGWGWDTGSALALYGWYTMLIYLASIPGGILADRYIGQKRAVMFGGALLVIGHSILAIDQLWTFYTGLALIILGVGALKPNISTMVSGLYKKGDERRDMGFYIFYLGINIGALAAALIVGYIGEALGWHYGFGLAGIGMALGLLIYWWGQKYLVEVGGLIKEEKTEFNNRPDLIIDIFKHNNSRLGFVLMLIMSILVWLGGSWGLSILTFGLAFVVGISLVVYNDGNRVEKDRILVTYITFLIIIVFWGAFEQAGGLLNVYTYEKTSLQLTQDFVIPASWFQSLNAIFIIIFTTIVGTFWAWWKNKKKESSSIFKMAIGVIIMGWGFFFMSFAANEVGYDSTGEVIKKSSMQWLILAYLFHTLGELCASPVALSFITKLAPARWMAFMMGLYFATTGLGNKVAGLLGEWSESIGEFNLFTSIGVFCTLIGFLILTILKPLKRLTHGVEEKEVNLGSESAIKKQPSDKKNSETSLLNNSNPWFLGIGINNYERFNPLNSAVRDVNEIRQLLSSKYDIDLEKTITLFDEMATRVNIIKALDKLAKTVKSTDKVLIYYSGHGHLDAKTGLGFWIPYDGRKEEPATYILDSTIRDYIKVINAQHTFLISDACFSRSLFSLSNNLAVKERQEQLEKLKSKWALCSGRHDEIVVDGVPGENSPFAASILRTLRDNDNTAFSVVTFIKKVIQLSANEYKQAPIGGPLHNVGDEGGQYFFRLKNIKR